MTTKAEIGEWFDRGVKESKKHMLIMCDTFDHSDYPVYTMTDAECIAKKNNPGEMQRVMEVYDLSYDKLAQMAESRAMHFPTSLELK